MGKFQIDKVAEEYVHSRFPNATKKENQKLIQDWVNKISSSRKLVEDFKLRVKDPRGLKMLDDGIGNGGISIAFAEAGAIVSGVEVGEKLIDIAREHAKAYSVEPDFFLVKGDKLPFEDNYFDCAISVSVFEHVSNPKEYLKEILRVLKPGGKLYFAFPNRLLPKEPHTLIYFIHWLPYFIARRLIKIFGRCPYEDNGLHFYTYFSFRDILNKVVVGDYSFSIIEEEGATKNIFKKVIKKILGLLNVPYKAVLSHVIIILEKK